MTSAKRKIAVFTGNRAEYGLLMALLRELKNDPLIDLRLIVSGAHLDPHFGNTIEDIRKDGFEIEAEVKIPLGKEGLPSIARAIGHAVIALVDVLERVKPDIFVVYADRFEGFAAAIAGSQMGLPTAHIEGGDITEGGALDDSVRHAMTKVAHLHFTTNQQAANRLLAMGEESWRVHNVGFPGIDLIHLGRVTPPDELVRKYGLDLERPIVLFTQHPVAVDIDSTEKDLKASLEALWKIASENDTQVIITYPNNDAGGPTIVKLLEERRAAGLPRGIQIQKSLGQANYYGVLALATGMKHRVVCAGNSSSGIKETAAFLCPTVNIGPRQDGRLRAGNVIDAPYESKKIFEALSTCLFDDVFRSKCLEIVNPYGTGDSSRKITDVLKKVRLDSELLRKKMTLQGQVKDGWFR